jgi:MFS family permease
MSFTPAVRRDLSLVLAAKGVSLLGDEVAALALTLRLQSAGAGTGAVAALLTAALLPLVVLAPLVGRLVDTHDSRAVLVSSSLAQAGLCALLAFQTATPAILLLVAALGAGQAVNGATWQALLPAIVGREQLPRALGLSQAAATLASIASPALAGILFGRFGARLPLLVDAATFLAITVVAVLVATRHGARPASRAAASGAGAGLQVLRRDPLLRIVLLLLALFVGLASMANVLDVFLVRGTLGASATWYGITSAVLAGGMLTASLLAGRMRGDRVLARAFVGSALVLAAGLLGLSAVPDVYWLLPVSAVIGAANGVLNVSLGALVMGRAASEVRGRVGAALNAVTSGAQVGAFAAGGALGAALTPREVFALAGALGLLAPLALGHRLIRAASRTPATGPAVTTATRFQPGRCRRPRCRPSVCRRPRCRPSVCRRDTRGHERSHPLGNPGHRRHRPGVRPRPRPAARRDHHRGRLAHARARRRVR